MEIVNKKISELKAADYNPRKLSKERDRKLYLNGKLAIEIVCKSCNHKAIVRKRGKKTQQEFCSRQCYGKSIAKYKVCLNCKKEFYNYQNKSFCTMVCAGELKTGKKLSDKHIAALSQAKAGKPILHFIDNKEEITAKISKALTGKPQPWNRGENHPNYKDGGKAAWQRQKAMGRVEYKEWRRQVFERDNYTCQSCDTRGGVIQADHVKPWSLYPEFRYDVANGKTLCKSCHVLTDTYGGNLKKYKEANGL